MNAESPLLVGCSLVPATIDSYDMHAGLQGRLLGKGVLKAVQNINDIIGPKLVGSPVLHEDA